MRILSRSILASMIVLAYAAPASAAVHVVDNLSVYTSTKADSPQSVLRQNAARWRAVRQRTMPLINKTQITDLERAELGSWIEAGAKLQ